MKLDKRIGDIDTIQTCLKYDVNSVGRKGYFFDNFVQAKVLTKTHYGTLVDIDVVDNDDHCFKARDKNGNEFVGYYRFFIPEDALKSIEKKYRAYTLNEFVNQYSLGDEVIVRHKEDKNIKHKLFTEFGENNDAVRLGCHLYTLQDLYDRYELYTGKGWKPFGVEE